eukprot:CAMPEP_0184491866 /NCGR_PEP_ID=MMETSP0113_2-20130426/21569_1 /TAXON_ID=91329 /ORGANISM="Norrisiella sphaerica, Strain BC52" /LENGTH=342 /DNA_ID=CAMNT_0026876409 /DNA_START=87 /DNA_END=1111 /DNA_ORIENTATION=-
MQAYMMIALAMKYYAFVLSSPKKIIDSVRRVVQKAVPGPLNPKSLPNGGQMVKMAKLLLTHRRLQYAICKGLALAASLTCLFLMLFGAYEIRGGSHGRWGIVWSSLPLLLTLCFLALSVYNMDDIQGARGHTQESTFLSLLQPCSSVLETLAIIPQVSLRLPKGRAGVSITTVLHFALRGAAAVLPSLIWLSRLKHGSLRIDQLGEMLMTFSTLTPGSLETFRHLVIACCGILYLVGLWRLCVGRRWLLAALAALAAVGVQLSGVMGPEGVGSLQERFAVDASEAYDYMLLTQICSIAALFVLGGTHFIQGVCLVAITFMHSAGLLPTSFSEAKQRIKARLA